MIKAKDLKSFFDAKSTHPILMDRVFRLPLSFSHHHMYSFPKWESEELFGNSNPVCIEYCSGNGDWIANKATEFPLKNWVAVEMRFHRVQKIWAKIKNNNLSNLIAICAEAWTFSHFYVGDCSIEEIYINFPDPWPKRRHEKHRLMQAFFIEEISRILKPHKKITFVTDESDYLQFSLKKLLAHAHLRPLISSPHYTKEWENYGTSWFEALWREKGRDIYYTHFEKSTAT